MELLIHTHPALHSLRLPACILWCCFCLCCSGAPNHQDGKVSAGNSRTEPAATRTISPVTRTKPPSGFKDTIEISSVAAVFFKPDTGQLQALQAITDSGVFRSMEHDCFYQQRNARNVIRSYYPEIKIVETRQAR